MIDSQIAERKALLNVAYGMCAVARTAPKTRGQDHIYTAVIETPEEIEQIAQAMEELYAEFPDKKMFARDAASLRKSGAVVLVGVKYTYRGLEEVCQLCQFTNCKDCADHHAVCVYAPMDLGIALGAAAAYAGQHHVDNRMHFSIAKAVQRLHMIPDEIKSVIAFPLSISGKSPFFDR